MWYIAIPSNSQCHRTIPRPLAGDINQKQQNNLQYLQSYACYQAVIMGYLRQTFSNMLGDCGEHKKNDFTAENLPHHFCKTYLKPSWSQTSHDAYQKYCQPGLSNLQPLTPFFPKAQQRVLSKNVFIVDRQQLTTARWPQTPDHNKMMSIAGQPLATAKW